MKNLFTILLMLSTLTFSTTLHAQDLVTDSATERVIDKYSDKIIGGFNDIITNVTPIAEEGFNIMVRLQIAKGIGMLLPLLITIIFLFLFQSEYRRLEIKHKDSSYGPFDECHITPHLIIYLVILIIFGIFAACTTYDGVLHLIVPEWFAIEQILNLF